MLPKTHIILGALFSIILFFFGVNYFNCILVFLSSFLIDFDHYLWYIIRKKDFNLKNAYYTLKGTEKKKLYLMVFHTIEFLLFILLLSYLWKGFLWIFIGMVFHSILDLIELYKEKELTFREFLLIKYIFSDKKNYA